MDANRAILKFYEILTKSDADFYDINIRFPPISSELPTIDQSTFLQQMDENTTINFTPDLQNELQTNINIINARVEYFQNFFHFFFSENRREVRVIRLYAMCMLYLANNSRVYETTFSDVFIKNVSQRELVFREDIFPSDPTSEDYDFDYVRKIDQLLFQSITLISEEDQKSLYTKILEYSYSNKDIKLRIYNFLPLFIKISKEQAKPDIKRIFLGSDLFTRILEESKTDIVLFDVVRFFITKNPFQSFLLNKSLKNALTDYYFIPNYQGTATDVITTSLGEIIILEQNQIVDVNQIEIIKTIESIIDRCNKNEVMKEKFIEIYPSVVKYFPQFSKNLFEFIIKENIFENLATLSISSWKLLKHYTQLLTRMYNRYYDFEYHMASRKYKIYDILKKYEGELEDLKYFKDLSFCSEGKNNENEKIKYIRNYKGIEVMVSLLSKMGDKEKEFSEFLFNQSKNAGNLLELSRAKVPEFILKRLTEIEREQHAEIVENYLKLFKNITSVVFNNSTFNRTIETLGQKSFLYGDEVIEIINDLLPNSSDNTNNDEEPKSFFRLDTNKGCGIFGPKLKEDVISNFSTSFCVRVNQINDDDDGSESSSDSQTPRALPLLFIQSPTSKVKIGLEIIENQIYVTEEDSKGRQAKPKETGILLEQGQWEFFQIFIKKKVIFKTEIKIHNKTQEFKYGLSNTIPRDACIFIGTKSSGIDSLSLMCDISTIIVSRGEDSISKEDILSPDNKRNDKIITKLDPMNGHKGICIDTGNNDDNIVEYRGRSIPFIPKIYEAFQTVGSLINILPLFEHSHTTKFYISLVQIFHKMIRITRKAREIFLESRFFELLASFLLKVDKKVLTFKFMEQLFSLYNELYDIAELRYQMAQYIILNYALIMRLEKQVYKQYICDLLPTIFEGEARDDPYHYSYLPSFIYQTYEFFSKDMGEISETAWSLLTTMIKHNIRYVRQVFGNENSKKLSYGYILMIYKFMMNLKTNYSTIKSLAILKSLLCDNYIEATECLKDDEIIDPFVGLLRQQSKEIQILAIEVIDKLRRDINFHKVIYRCGYALDTEYRIPPELIETIFKLFIVYDEQDPQTFIEFVPDYLPFLSFCCSTYAQDDKDLVREICDKITIFLTEHQNEGHRILSIPCWFDCMSDLYRYIYDPVREYQMFSQPFSSLFEIDFQDCKLESLNKFFYSLDNSSIEDTRNVKRFILLRLVHDNQLSSRQINKIFTNVFDFLVFDKKFKFDKGVSGECFLRTVTEENVNDEEIELVNSLISYLSEGDDNAQNEVIIDDTLRMNVVLADSLLVSMYLRWRPNLYVEALKQIKKCLAKVDAELSMKCSSVLVEPFIGHEFGEGEEELKEAISSFDVHLMKNGKKVSDSIIKNNKENVLKDINNNITGIQSAYYGGAQKIILERIDDRKKNLGVDENGEDSDENDIDRIRELFATSLTESMCNPDTSRGVSFDNRVYMYERRREYRIEMKRILKMKDSFLQSLSRRPGPWLKEGDSGAKYKAFNYISKKGQRIMLRINDNFDDHMDASDNTRETALQTKDASSSKAADEYRMPYKTSEKVDEFYLQINQFNAILQKIANNYDGVIKFTDRAVLFIPGKGDKSDGSEGSNPEEEEENEDEAVDTDKKVTIEFGNIGFILDRRVYREEKGIEIFLDNYKSYFFIFPNKDEKERFYTEIDKLITPRSVRERMQSASASRKFDFLGSLRRESGSIHQNMTSKDLVRRMKLAELWQNNKLTNYEYLYYLNMLGGRSFNYPNQYPIFPVLLKECNGDTFDLTEESMYRDLGEPIMKLNRKNFQNLVKQFKGADPSYKCLVYTMPSSGFYPSLLLSRVEPFTSLQISISTTNGTPKFDDTNRQFYSVAITFYESLYNCYSQNLNEAVPELYTFPFMFYNENKFDLGERTDDPKGPIDNVILPPWCMFNKASGEEDKEAAQILNSHIFSSVARIALESEYASRNLHRWINMYFTAGRGYCKNDDPEANDETNYQMFMSYSYPENKNPEIYVPDYEHIGMLPEILFDAHPKKNLVDAWTSKKLKKLEELPETHEEAAAIIKEVAFMKNWSVVDLHQGRGCEPISVPRNIGELQCVIRGAPRDGDEDGACLAVFCTKQNPFVTVVSTRGAHRLRAECHITSAVTSVAGIGNRFLIVGGSDSSVSVWEVAFAGDDFSIQQVSASGFHTDEVVSIGGCYENGLVASLDKRGILVFETLLDQNFISFADLGSGDLSDGSSSAVRILVFKSGVVAVTQRARVLLFDCHGKLLRKWEPEECEQIFDAKKYYDADTRELLLVGYRKGSDNRIDIFDLTTFRTVETLGVNFDSMCPVKRTRRLIVSNSHGFSTVSFSHAIQTMISPKD